MKKKSKVYFTPKQPHDEQFSKRLNWLIRQIFSFGYNNVDIYEYLLSNFIVIIYFGL